MAASTDCEGSEGSCVVGRSPADLSSSVDLDFPAEGSDGRG